MFVTTVLVSVLCYFFYKYLMNMNEDYWGKKNVTYLRNASPYYLVWRFISESAPVCCKNIYDKYNDVPAVGLMYGTKPALLLRDPENIQAVFSNDFMTFYERGFNVRKELLTDHIVFIDEYVRWKLIRQSISPLFTSAKLKNMFYILERCAKDFSFHIDDNKDLLKEPFNLISIYTAASIGSSVFGLDTKVENSMQSPFIDMVRKAIDPSPKMVFAYLLKDAPDFIRNLLVPNVYAEHEPLFIGLFKKLLQERRKQKVFMHDFLDICIDLQQKGSLKDHSTNYEVELSDEVLAAQAFFFFLAGVDSTAVVIHFTLLELASHVDILSKVHEEIDQVFEQCDEKLTYDDIDKLKYLEMVINESMRKYPLGFLQRVCTKKTVLPVGNIPVEKGTNIFISTFALHRDAKYFPNPDVFDPERFSQENVANIIKYTYLPFGLGNRACIGTQYTTLYTVHWRLVEPPKGHWLKIPPASAEPVSFFHLLWHIAPDLFPVMEVVRTVESQRHPWSLLAFILGARYARLQLLTGLAWLLRRHTLKYQELRIEKYDRSFFSVRASKERFDLVRR